MCAFSRNVDRGVVQTQVDHARPAPCYRWVCLDNKGVPVAFGAWVGSREDAVRGFRPVRGILQTAETALDEDVPDKVAV